ncbi:hypothetical protein B7R21_08785 [Subtercola boreus]|uniref:Uncharacterized protein n=1 Tax=Subtercola boreus TaxID=120213 RepID=A0A3E0VTI5_9MICO|nr:hypothetical protein [Subtercola boreus]RFA12935.1 hypothetical protein B7R21_08785 [Subtercola boreus]
MSNESGTNRLSPTGSSTHLTRRALLSMLGLAVPAVAITALTPAAMASTTAAVPAVAPAAAAASTLPSYGVKAAARSSLKVVTGRDFAQSNYCWYEPTITSLKNVAYTIAPNSSTKASAVPVQVSGGVTNPFSLMRLGPNNSTSGQQVVVDGLLLTGTAQPPSAANPGKTGHNYHGLTVYWGRNNIIANSTFIAASWGDANSPPGETFAIMGYKDTDTYIKNVEVDGRTPDGTRVGGSPMGFNNSTRPVIEDSYLHHSLVSSLTFSTAGNTPSVANATSSPTTRRIRIEHNANTKMERGYRFTGINHEHVLGTIKHYLPTIAIDWTEWTASHMWFGSWLSSAEIRITIDPASITGGYRNNMGCLTLAIPTLVNGRTNQQKLSDVVVTLPDGTPLKPYIVSSPQGSPMPISRNTHYVVNVG